VQRFTARMPLLIADSNQCIRIREKTLEFSSTVLFTLSLHLIIAAQTVNISAYRIAGNDEPFISRDGKQSDESIRSSACCQQAHHCSLGPRETITDIATDASAKTLQQQQHL